MSLSKATATTTVKDKTTGDTVEVGTKSGGEKGMHVIAEIPSTNGPIAVIQEDHSQIHNGNSYYLHGRETLGNGQVKQWVFKTATKKLHLLIDLFAEKETDTRLVEDLNVVSQGTLETPINRDRNSANTSDASFYEGIYAISEGGAELNLINTFITGGATGQGNNDSMMKRDASELILLPNTWYSLTLTSRINSNMIAWIIDWYEV